MTMHSADVATSALCIAELIPGIHKEPYLARARRQRIDLLLSRIPKLAFDVQAAQAYDRIVEHCGFARARAFDRLIAAQAISLNLTLVTDNEADFADIPDLVMENWVTP